MSNCVPGVRPPCLRAPVETTLGQLTADLERCGRRILVLYGTALPSSVRNALASGDTGFRLFEMSGAEPSPLDESVAIGAAICRQERIDAILAAGGPQALAFAVRVSDQFREMDPSCVGVEVVHLFIDSTSLQE